MSITNAGQKDDLLNRVPPHNLEAEAACLGAMMMNSYAVERVTGIIRDEDFFDIKNQIIFRACLELHKRLVPIDIVSVSEYLKSKGELEGVGGSAYISRLVEGVPAATNVSYYAKIVLDKSVMRNLINTCSNIIYNVFAYQTEVDRVLDDAGSAIIQATQRREEHKTVRVRDAVVQSLRAIDANKDKAIIGEDTGYPELNRMIKGWQPAKFYVIAARPSMGKSTFAVNLGIKFRRPCLLFAHEMTAREISDRILSSDSRVPLDRLQSPSSVTDGDWKELLAAAAMADKYQLIICDEMGLNISQINAIARNAKLRDKIEMVIIDHLQLIEAETKKSWNRTNELAVITKSLKRMTKELQIPVIALSQLNRENERRDDHRPRLSDLRDSGTIEQDADVIAFLHREDYYVEDKGEIKEISETELIIAKQRNGKLGKIKFQFYKDYQRFEEKEYHRGDF